MMASMPYAPAPRVLNSDRPAAAARAGARRIMTGWLGRTRMAPRGCCASVTRT